MKSGGSSPSPPLHVSSPHPRDDPMECSNGELLSPPLQPLPSPAALHHHLDYSPPSPSPAPAKTASPVTASSPWRLNINEFRLPPQTQTDDHLRRHLRRLCPESNSSLLLLLLSQTLSPLPSYLIISPSGLLYQTPLFSMHACYLQLSTIENTVVLIF